MSVRGEAKGAAVMAKLDNTDYKILEILQSDGRISYSDLAEKVSLSRAAVRERVNSMKESGIIRGFTAIIDAKAYEKFASLYMDIEVEPSKLEYVAHELLKLEEIAIVSQHTGSTGPACPCLYRQRGQGRKIS